MGIGEFGVRDLETCWIYDLNSTPQMKEMELR